MEKIEKKQLMSYVDESMYEEIRELAFALNISMSKCIAECIVQGIEMIIADVAGRDPKVVSKSMKRYLRERNINISD